MELLPNGTRFPSAEISNEKFPNILVNGKLPLLNKAAFLIADIENELQKRHFLPEKVSLTIVNKHITLQYIETSRYLNIKLNHFW